MWKTVEAYAGPSIESDGSDVITDDYKCGFTTTDTYKQILPNWSPGTSGIKNLIKTGGSTPCSTYSGKSDTIIISKPW